MSWATIRDLKQVDQEQNSANPFAIPTSGGSPLQPGNSLREPIFYKADIQVLLEQANDVAGVRLVNAYLSTDKGGVNNPIPLTFLVAYREINGKFVNLNEDDNKLAITCPPVYIENQELDKPQPGMALPIETIREIKSNGYE